MGHVHGGVPNQPHLLKWPHEPLGKQVQETKLPSCCPGKEGPSVTLPRRPGRSMFTGDAEGWDVSHCFPGSEAG